MWLRDALPEYITGDGGNGPIARVMIYGYDSYLSDSESFQNIGTLGLDFQNALRSLEADGEFRQIVLIAHSLGGLIVKQVRRFILLSSLRCLLTDIYIQALIDLARSQKEKDQNLKKAVYGIAFFGVPHDGMNIRSLIPMVGDRPNRFLLESIGSASPQVLIMQHRDFPEALGGKGESEIVCFFETVMSPTAQQVSFHPFFAQESLLN